VQENATVCRQIADIGDFGAADGDMALAGGDVFEYRDG